MSAGRVILVDDEEEIRLATAQTLELRDFEVTCLARAERALERVRRGFEGVLVSDIRMPQMDGLTLLEAVHEIDPDLPVILITGHGDVPLAVAAMRAGAYDFLEKPFPPRRLTDAVERASEKRRLTLENRQLRQVLEKRDSLESALVGRTEIMVALRHRIRTIAKSDVDVLLLGETGSGKELAARALHDLSERRDKPFVAINMAALPADLLESELFGFEMGVAGAPRARVGKFEHARGGTLFLDEIGALTPVLQAKLLRVIQERVIERLGSNEPIPLDVRFLASTKEDLARAVAEDRFRDDLYYRLNVVSVTLPPLRDRIADVPLLFPHLVEEAARRYRRPAPVVTGQDLAAISARAWPGNVRELRNAADRFVLGLAVEDPAATAERQGLAQQVEAFEKQAIVTALARHGGSLKATYEDLGLSRKTLYEKMVKHGLKREDFAES
ncbi:MAG: sigma-54 dependent transcriptional regulator [Rhodospirillales bacterium]